ncbi:MAG: DUF1566 domain-containing protein [Polaromonas sp.]|nr:DUF1566 domain-containing protein [Polaromonas sp.]
MRRHVVGLLGLTLLFGVAGAFAQERFKVSGDGLEVADSKTGLTWRRCAEGMALRGKTCAGQPVFVSHVEALSRGKAAGAGWRLPELKELATLAAPREAGEGQAAIDPAAFPGTPIGRFWTSTTSGHGYFSFVGFSDGSAGENTRTSPGAVRLVRGGP